MAVPSAARYGCIAPVLPQIGAELAIGASAAVRRELCHSADAPFHTPVEHTYRGRVGCSRVTKLSPDGAGHRRRGDPLHAVGDAAGSNPATRRRVTTLFAPAPRRRRAAAPRRAALLLCCFAAGLWSARAPRLHMGSPCIKCRLFSPPSPRSTSTAGWGFAPDSDRPPGWCQCDAIENGCSTRAEHSSERCRAI